MCPPKTFQKLIFIFEDKSLVLLDWARYLTTGYHWVSTGMHNWNSTGIPSETLTTTGLG
jgi:hypothetical protein